ncbi:MAG: helix-hairpin-helix domain-containing protein [Acidimicrobiia bacterium]
MKKVARLLGLLGGVAAVAWAMRDRFVSIASPREPEPPTFRVVTPPSAPPTPRASDPDDLTEVNGIGPVFARRLMEAGISTYAELARATPGRVAEVAGIPEARVTDWIEQAGQRI